MDINESDTAMTQVSTDTSSGKRSLENGISADEALLRAQGHKGELPRRFDILATLSIAFLISNSWAGYCAAFITPLLAGGGPAVFYALPVAAVCAFTVSESAVPSQRARSQLISC